MTDKQKQYYYEMAKKGRLLFLNVEGKVRGLITFYIGSEKDENKFIRNNMWEVLDDDKNGRTCWIDHLLTDKDRNNPYYSLFVWQDIKNYFKNNFPNINKIYFRRWKNNRINIHKEVLNERV